MQVSVDENVKIHPEKIIRQHIMAQTHARYRVSPSFALLKDTTMCDARSFDKFFATCRLQRFPCASRFLMQSMWGRSAHRSSPPGVGSWGILLHLPSLSIFVFVRRHSFGVCSSGAEIAPLTGHFYPGVYAIPCVWHTQNLSSHFSLTQSSLTLSSRPRVQPAFEKVCLLLGASKVAGLDVVYLFVVGPVTSVAKLR